MAGGIRIAIGVEPRFTNLVRLLESYSKRNPLGYKVLVMGFALAGYAYIIGIFVLVIATVWLGLTLLRPLLIIGGYYVLFPVLGFAGILLRSLWQRLPVPEGCALLAADSPRLFEVLEDTRRKTNGPHIHHVIVSSDFNASVAQIPRLGPLGWHRNYLIVGLPLLLALTEDELRAVIAHEYGHLAGRHGHFACWIYQLRRAWWYLAFNLQARARWSTWLFRPFWRYYVPHFNACSFVLARANEYEADRLALSAVGAAPAAQALMRVGSVGHYLTAQFWTPLFKQADFSTEPPFPPYARMIEMFDHPLDQRRLEEGLALAFASSTDLSDTHPCLRDRLAAIGGESQQSLQRDHSAAYSLLGRERIAVLAAQIDTAWRYEVAPQWQASYEASRNDRHRLTELTEREEAGTATSTDRIDRAGLTERFISEEAAMPLYEAIVAEDKEAAFPRFALGRYKVQRDDPSGIDFLEEASQLDDDYLIPSCDVAYVYLIRNGHNTEAEAYRKRAREFREQLNEAAPERGMPRLRDRFEPHGLKPSELEQMVTRVAKFHDVRRAYLVRRRVRVLPARPSNVLIVRTYSSPKWLSFSLAQTLAEETRLRGDTFVVLLTTSTMWLELKAKRVSGALIVSR